MTLNQQQLQHFYLRAGFGAPYNVIQEGHSKTPSVLLENQFKLAKNSQLLGEEDQFNPPKNYRSLSFEEQAKLRKQNRIKVRDLNVQWLKQMVSSSATLHEKMTFFWHDHFACRPRLSSFATGYLNVLRTHALGNFRDLLLGVSKSPAMLQYLNNQQNKKSSPNENFAREVMELFTLGRDMGYTEKDIAESARAFTGWGFNRKGEFVFRRAVHDYANKQVFGKTGNFDGDAIIDLLLSKKQTARYIAQKWVQFFVNYKGHQILEQRIADRLFEKDYDIQSGLEVLFTSKEFYEANNIGTRIKSPIELIVSLQRQLHVQIEHDLSLIYLQRTLGQLLFDPPNVAGWNDGVDWVDSASLLFRINLPKYVFKSAHLKHLPNSFDANDQFKMARRLKRLETKLDAEGLEASIAQLSDAELSQYLLQVPAKVTQKSRSIVDRVVQITSKPEYQLC